MRQAIIRFKAQDAGILTQEDDGTFTFRYLDSWLDDKEKPAISLTLPKSTEPLRSDYLFPFFYSLLPEGPNKAFVCKHNRLDPDDDFGILLTSARYDSVGAVTVIKITT